MAPAGPPPNYRDVAFHGPNEEYGAKPPLKASPHFLRYDRVRRLVWRHLIGHAAPTVCLTGSAPRVIHDAAVRNEDVLVPH